MRYLTIGLRIGEDSLLCMRTVLDCAWKFERLRCVEFIAERSFGSSFRGQRAVLPLTRYMFTKSSLGDSTTETVAPTFKELEGYRARFCSELSACAFLNGFASLRLCDRGRRIALQRTKPGNAADTFDVAGE